MTYCDQFLEFGIVTKRAGAKCPRCGAIERHRLLWLYLTRKTNLLDRGFKRMLHIAPEIPIERLLRYRLGLGYLTVDLHDPRAHLRMDITNMRYPEDTFDVVCCCHVLEHILQDRLAIREIRRVLRPGGWATVLVPITASETFEDATIVEPSDRLRYFGQEDHVRRYGPDFLERLFDAGFAAEMITASSFLSEQEITLMGIDPDGRIYHCLRE
jgi:SAM-dependent methyltransferase